MLRPKPELKPGLPKELPPGPKPEPLLELKPLQDPVLPQKRRPESWLPQELLLEIGLEHFLVPKLKIVPSNKPEPEQRHRRKPKKEPKEQRERQLKPEPTLPPWSPPRPLLQK